MSEYVIAVYCAPCSRVVDGFELGENGWEQLGGAAQFLHGDGYMASTAADLIHPGNYTRIRHRLKCAECSDTVVARAEKLEPVLDALAESGVSNISLRGLAASIVV